MQRYSPAPVKFNKTTAIQPDIQTEVAHYPTHEPKMNLKIDTFPFLTDKNR